MRSINDFVQEDPFTEKYLKMLATSDNCIMKTTYLNLIYEIVDFNPFKRD